MAQFCFTESYISVVVSTEKAEYSSLMLLFSPFFVGIQSGIVECKKKARRMTSSLAFDASP